MAARRASHLDQQTVYLETIHLLVVLVTDEFDFMVLYFLLALLSHSFDVAPPALYHFLR